MYFITCFPKRTRQRDAVMGVVDKLRKSTHFVVVKYTHTTSDVSHVFIKDIVRLYEVTKKIISDMDAKFTSKF